MNHPVSKASLTVQHSVPSGSATQSTPIKRRSTFITILGPRSSDDDTKRRHVHFRAKTVSTATALPHQEPNSDTRGKPSRKRRTKPPSTEFGLMQLDKLRWLTVAQAALRYPSFSEKALRHLIAQAEAYAKHPKSGLRSNGFIACIVRPAGQRKILIDAEKFECWLSSCTVGAKS